MKIKHLILFCVLVTLSGCALRIISAITSGAQVGISVYEQLDQDTQPTPEPQVEATEAIPEEDYEEEA